MSYNDAHTRITLVAAVDHAMAIGKGGKVPWHLKADMDHFVKLTMGQIVVMGRKTYEVSIPRKYRPLPGRENWILTRNQNYAQIGCRVFYSMERVLEAATGREIFVIGGAQIYELFLLAATRVIMTRVNTLVRGADTFMPEIPGAWNERVILTHGADRDNDHSFSIVEYTAIEEM